MLLLLVISCALSPSASRAQAPVPEAQVAWRLLDYLAVDYAGAVTNGEIKNAAEYAEMIESMYR